ncbi:RNA/RNP complex-1-interacting phosphatase-like, partial [Stylophora pistillata]|uniref:RNA/RNP complex-1-interacting phosphatase-like n=1 Tax=Stylophora pistillata TaxID=50429 RepID=UPI000C04830E
WRDYTRCGVPIPGERIIVFKTPLSHEFDSKSDQDKKIKPHERFTPMDLENHVSQKNIKLKMVVDLTNTNADTYYNPKELCDHGIPHRKIKCVGKQIPDENVVERFKTAVCTFMKENSNSDSVVGVHCTHGVNRSGYVVCRYLIECKGYTPQDAIKAFNKTRGHHMEYTDHLEDLLEKKARLDFPSYVCIGDNRKWDEIPFEEDKTNWRSNNIRGNTKGNDFRSRYHDQHVDRYQPPTGNPAQCRHYL